MKRINKKTWALVAGCVLVVAAALTLPALWMIGQQDSKMGRVTYLPDYTTIVLGEKAAENPVARSLYEHKQTYLIQGDQADWGDLDPEALVLLEEEINELEMACPTVQTALEELQLEELMVSPDYATDAGTLLGFERLDLNRTAMEGNGNGFYSRKYWVLNISRDTVTQKIMALYMEYNNSDTVWSGTEYGVQTELLAEILTQEADSIEGAVAAMAKEYMAYLGLEENSFQKVDLTLPAWQEEYEMDRTYYTQAFYSPDYQVYLYASLGYGTVDSVGLNLGAASLTPEELEKCLTPYA